jgi:6-phosphogluconolactonase
MTLHISDTVDELLVKLAEYFVDAANESIGRSGRFSVALSGGSSPEKLYELLASPVFCERVDWSKVYFFLGDERYVPLTDPASNFKMVNTVLFSSLNIDALHTFPVNTGLSPAAAAADYMQQIGWYFKDSQPCFDLVLLGLGDNSHTASLFPFTDILNEQEATVKSVFLPDQLLYRISFTAPLINLAHRVAFLVYGSAKAYAVKNVLEGAADISNFPAQLIHPVDGALDWFLDTAAAAKILKN